LPLFSRSGRGKLSATQNLENIIDKALLLAVYPFFALVLICGIVLWCARGGRPLSLKLKGFGISFELNSINKDSSESKEETKC